MVARKDQPNEKADSKRQRTTEDEPPSKRQKIEEELEQICVELKRSMKINIHSHNLSTGLDF